MIIKIDFNNPPNGRSGDILQEYTANNDLKTKLVVKPKPTKIDHTNNQFLIIRTYTPIK